LFRAERLEVVATGRDERVARRKAGGRDRERTPIAGLCVLQLAGHLTHDGQVVQGLGDLVLWRARRRFLQCKSVSQQPFSGVGVFARDRLFDGVENLPKSVGSQQSLPIVHFRTEILLPRS
jgi:hypothetical protein